MPASIIVAEPEKAAVDPFGDLKSRVHHDVITRIGPRLFARAEAEGTSELAERVREAVDEAIAIDKTPLTRQERAQVAARSPTTSSATDRSSRSCATRRSPRSW